MTCHDYLTHFKLVNRMVGQELEIPEKTTRLIFVCFIWVLRPVKIISLILSQANRKVGQKLEIPD